MAKNTPPTKNRPLAKKAPAGRVKAKVLEVVRHLYGDDRTEAQLLAFDPNSVDAPDPGMLYELLGTIFGVLEDPNDDCFGGFGGRLSQTIAFIERAWDGETLEDRELPPPLVTARDKARAATKADETGPRFFWFWTRGSPDKPERAVVRDAPVLPGFDAERPRRGERIGIVARLELRVASGDQLTPLLSNLLGWLLVDESLKEVLLANARCEIEVVPIVLRDPAGALLSKRYSLVNVLGTFDCVDAASSKLIPEAQAKIRGGQLSSGLVFDRAKVKASPQLFRVPEDPARLFIGLELMRALKAADLMAAANVLVVEAVPLTP